MSDLRTELLAIRERKGKLNPRIVLEEARKPSSPLHTAKNWLWDDDEAAAERYRKGLAQELITEIEIRYVDAKGHASSARAFYSVRTDDADGWDYVPTENIGKDPFLRKLFINEMRRRVDELVRTYEHVQEFWAVIEETKRKKKKTG